MQVVIINDAGYELPEKCFGIPVRARFSAIENLVYIKRDELVRIGAFESGEWIPDEGLSFYIGTEVKIVNK